MIDKSISINAQNRKVFQVQRLTIIHRKGSTGNNQTPIIFIIGRIGRGLDPAQSNCAINSSVDCPYLARLQVEINRNISSHRSTGVKRSSIALS